MGRERVCWMSKMWGRVMRVLGVGEEIRRSGKEKMLKGVGNWRMRMV